MATSSDLLHTNESNNGSDESISNCANSSNITESLVDDESIQTTNADCETATSPGVDENEDVDSKAEFGATSWYDKYDKHPHAHTLTHIHCKKNITKYFRMYILCCTRHLLSTSIHFPPARFIYALILTPSLIFS